MEPVTVIAAVAPMLGGLLSAASACLQRRAGGRRLSRRTLKALPPGSRMIDLGEHGLLIEIGERPPLTPATGDE
jgi:hypothetical protein